MALLTEFGAKIQTQPRPFCWKCGAQMYLRVPKPDADWLPFWGCSQFRSGDCDGSRNIDPRTGEPEKRDSEKPYNTGAW